jgi:serine/threonine-protein kinase
MSQADKSGQTSFEDTTGLGHVQPFRDLTGATLGDFHVDRLLGRGGMGEVYLARQVSLNRPVALKVLRPDLLARPQFLSRFEAEATVVAKLNHPNIVHIYMLGTTDGVRYIAMEYVQGTNLRDYIRKKGAVDYPLALSIMRQSAMAIGAAGEIGLIHRDLKPENLLLTRKGQVKIADFGLCRDVDTAHLHLTQTGITMGTPMYMSPEQAQGHALDHRSDLYSLGVTFYHMLTGDPPFKAGSALAVAMKHVRDMPASMAVHRPDISPDLDRLVLKLLAKNPVERYQSAAEVLRDLTRIREQMQTPSGAQTVSLPGPGPSGSAPALIAEPALLPVVATAPQVSPLSGSALRIFLVAPEAVRSRFGLGSRLALAFAALAAGALTGWAGRPADLLSTHSASVARMPGLWLQPRWGVVPRANNAESQYHYAQIRAPNEELEAAWLAVPGYFETSQREWTYRAYAQIARMLVVRRDLDRLDAFAQELAHWEGGKGQEKQLADIMTAGVSALKGDLGEVLDIFVNRVPPVKLTDPALVELSLEVTSEAERAASKPGAPSMNALARRNLNQIQWALKLKLLDAEPRGGPMFNRIRPG